MKKSKSWKTKESSIYRMDDGSVLNPNEYRMTAYDYIVQRYMEKNGKISTK